MLVELYCKRRELSDLNETLAEANKRLSQANVALQAEATRELQQLNSTLQHTNLSLERTNLALQAEVADRTRAEDALKEADRQKDEFLAMLAHELRNPLAPIRNGVSLMKAKVIDDPQLLQARDIIERQLGQLTRLVDDLLDVSRITRGKITLARERMPLGELLARAVETVAPLIGERGHELVVDPVDRRFAVYGDGIRLTQVLSNVLANAVKYTDPGGQIALSSRRRGRNVEIAVRDNGIGIAPEVLPRIFELFTQLDQRAERAQSGLGIGLALVKRLVEMHHGTVSAYSDGLGNGSTFTISLPLSIERGAAEVASTERSSSDSQGELADVSRRGRKVLVADDNADALQSLAMLLELDGHEVYRAADGREACALAEQVRPEVMFLDIGMPHLDGLDVARHVRAAPWGKEVRLVALTGWGQESDRKHSREAGFDCHLTKPVEYEKLNAIITRGAVDA